MEEHTNVVNIINSIVQQPFIHQAKQDRGNRLKTLKFQ
jgi:hypothetical protein